MRLSRKQSSNATESPAVKLDKKNTQKTPGIDATLEKLGNFTAPASILPIASQFYRYKNKRKGALFLVFLPILPILPIKRLT
jgi:hypothetical protein